MAASILLPLVTRYILNELVLRIVRQNNVPLLIQHARSFSTGLPKIFPMEKLLK